jgi:hypothetical protein
MNEIRVSKDHNIMIIKKEDNIRIGKQGSTWDNGDKRDNAT